MSTHILGLRDEDPSSTVIAIGFTNMLNEKALAILMVEFIIRYLICPKVIFKINKQSSFNYASGENLVLVSGVRLMPEYWSAHN